MAIPEVKFSKNQSNDERFAVLTGIEAGDQIDIVSILGRKATKIVITTTDPTDTILYKVNTLVKRKVLGDNANRYLPQTKGMIKKSVSYWEPGTELSAQGASIELSMGAINFASLEITGVTLDVGTTVTVTLY